MTERAGIGSKLRDPLKGWEFTPAMRQQVLQRAQEPEARPVRSPYKAVAWSAVAAAAAFAIAINLSRFGAPERDTAQAEVGTRQMGQVAQEAMPQTVPAPVPAPSAPMESAKIAAQDAQGAKPTSPAGVAQSADSAAPESPPKSLPTGTRVGRFEPLAAPPASNSLMAAAPPEGALAAGAGSGFAVASGPSVSVHDGTGKVVRTYTVSGTQVTGLEMVTADGPLAVGVDGERVQVYGALEIAVPGVTFALNPTDGALAVYDGRMVTVYGTHGQVVWRQGVQEPADQILFAGNVLVVGGAGLDAATGDIRWAQMAHGRLAGLNADMFVRWDEAEVAGFRTGDGSRAWTFRAPEGHRVTSVAGNAGRLAVVAERGDGSVLWVVDASEQVLYTAALTERIAGVAVTGEGRVLLLLPGGRVGAIPVADLPQ